MRKLIYIIGTANCGSTLLTKVLACHPDIATIGELKATAIRDIENYNCSCGEKLLLCKFWKKVSLLCYQRGFKFDLHDFKTRFQADSWFANRVLKATVHGSFLETIRKIIINHHPSTGKALAKVASNNSILISAICEVQNKAVFLDGSKDPARVLHFHRAGNFDLFVIHLIRDGRAVVASYKKRDLKHKNNIRLWKTKSMECERLKKLLPKEKMLTIRYEDFCKETESTLAQIYNFVDVSKYDPFKDDNQSLQHIIGHGMRLGKIGEISERKEWPKLLTSVEIEKFYERGGSINQQLGYSR